MCGVIPITYRYTLEERVAELEELLPVWIIAVEPHHTTLDGWVAKEAKTNTKGHTFHEHV